MTKSEILARIILFTALIAAVAAGSIAAVPGLTTGGLSSGSMVELHARMPENGGWSLETIEVQAGQPVHLRMTSDDVLHSFVIGQSDRPPVDILPGKWEEATLIFDDPGRYTFYCTRWCGRNHWRMRGTILVTGEDPERTSVQAEEETKKPLYLELGLEIDAPHYAEIVPQDAPSAEHGQALEPRLPSYALDRDTYMKNSPEGVWKQLRAEPSLADLDNAALWDAVAWIWSRQSTPAEQAAAAERFATNCAACHGETGQGDGVMVEGLPRFDPTHIHITGDAVSPSLSGSLGQGELMLSAPGDFTDPRLLLGASPALLEGKILRGGMGTGMPYWGPIFTEEETDALIAYLYQFAMATK